MAWIAGQISAWHVFAEVRAADRQSFYRPVSADESASEERAAGRCCSAPEPSSIGRTHGFAGVAMEFDVYESCSRLQVIHFSGKRER